MAVLFTVRHKVSLIKALFAFHDYGEIGKAQKPILVQRKCSLTLLHTT